METQTKKHHGITLNSEPLGPPENCVCIRKGVRSISRLRVGHGVIGPRVPLDVGICTSLSDTVRDIPVSKLNYLQHLATRHLVTCWQVTVVPNSWLFCVLWSQRWMHIFRQHMREWVPTLTWDSSHSLRGFLNLKWVQVKIYHFTTHSFSPQEKPLKLVCFWCFLGGS